MADEVLPGKPYLIQSGDDIVRAVVVGTVCSSICLII